MDAMEVLEPLWLREEVKERIKILQVSIFERQPINVLLSRD